MNITNKLIQLIDSEIVLRNNAVIEANSFDKTREKRAENLEKIMISLADEDNTPWFSFSLASIVFETVNWVSIIIYYEGEKVTEA
jgi:hypothetical protein